MSRRNIGLFTPTERRIRGVLADGKPHLVKELMDVLNDDLCDQSNLRKHISNMRRKMRGTAEDVIAVRGNNLYYQLIHLSSTSAAG